MPDPMSTSFVLCPMSYVYVLYPILCPMSTSTIGQPLDRTALSFLLEATDQNVQHTLRLLDDILRYVMNNLHSMLQTWGFDTPDGQKVWIKSLIRLTLCDWITTSTVLPLQLQLSCLDPHPLLTWVDLSFQHLPNSRHGRHERISRVRKFSGTTASLLSLPKHGRQDRESRPHRDSGHAQHFSRDLSLLTTMVEAPEKLPHWPSRPHRPHGRHARPEVDHNPQSSPFQQIRSTILLERNPVTTGRTRRAWPVSRPIVSALLSPEGRGLSQQGVHEGRGLLDNYDRLDCLTLHVPCIGNDHKGAIVQQAKGNGTIAWQLTIQDGRSVDW